MKINSKILINLSIIFFCTTLYADKNAFHFMGNPGSYDVGVLINRDANRCDTKKSFPGMYPFDPYNTFLTFYGDSLGDFVEQPLYGYYGWESYMNIFHPEIKWNVQNLAKVSWTTIDVYKLIQVDCNGKDSEDKDIGTILRTNYKTSENVAIEIGGNDILGVTPALTFMPWRLFSYYDPISQTNVPGVPDRIVNNIKAIVYTLRYPRRDKSVLVMGNFPALSYSPTLGNVGDYFKPLKQQPTGNFTSSLDRYLQELGKIRETVGGITVAERGSGVFVGGLPNSILGFDSQTSLGTSLDAFNAEMQNIKSMLMGGATNYEIINSNYLSYVANIPTGQDSWYWVWLNMVKNNLTTIGSMALLLTQPKLEAMVNDSNVVKSRVYFLPLYQYFINPQDCAAGYCYVANPLLMGDSMHINFLGYMIWASFVSAKVKELGWHNTPRPPHDEGGVSNPSDYVPPPPDIPPPQPVIVTPTPIDWMLLFCLFTGKCW